MDNQLFRKKSLDRISSPEELHDYMRVTSPKLWMLLGAIIILLVGFIVYASTATMESTMPIHLIVENYKVYDDDEERVVGRDSMIYAYLPYAMRETVSNDMVIRVGDESGKISTVAVSAPGEMAEENVTTIMITMDNPRLAMPDGEYDATLVLESTTPISFLWN